jgi:hypothetical protein
MADYANDGMADFKNFSSLTLLWMTSSSRMVNHEKANDIANFEIFALFDILLLELSISVEYAVKYGVPISTSVRLSQTHDDDDETPLTHMQESP